MIADNRPECQFVTIEVTYLKLASVVVLPTGADLERYLIDEGHHAGIKQGIADLYGPEALARFSRHRYNRSLKRRQESWKSSSIRTRAPTVLR